jgi:hypothetical protein
MQKVDPADGYNGALIGTAMQFSLAGDPRGVPGRELLRPGPPGLPANLAQAFMSLYSYENPLVGGLSEGLERYSMSETFERRLPTKAGAAELPAPLSISQLSMTQRHAL